MRKRRSAEAGFTLLEVLIAVTLLALLAVGLYSILRIGIHSWQQGAGYIDANQRHRTVVDLVRKQIASAYPLSPSSDQRQSLTAATTTTTTTTTTSSSTAYPIFNGYENGFCFVSVNSLQFWASPGLSFVTYEIAPGANGANSLIVKEAPYTGQLMVEDAANSSSSGSANFSGQLNTANLFTTIGSASGLNLTGTTSLAKETIIFDNISEYELAYFDPGSTSSSTSTSTSTSSTSTTSSTPQWVASWSGKDKMRLPTAVSMTLVSRDTQGREIYRYIVAPLKAEAKSTQTTTVRAR